MRTRLRISSILVAASVTFGGCGEPERVTYVDPNGDTGVRQADGVSLEPVARFGIASVERAKAVVRLRSSLDAARIVYASDPSAARDTITRSIDEDLPSIEPRAIARDRRIGRALGSSLRTLRNTPPANAVEYGRAARQATGLVEAAYNVVVAPSARQDVGFRAALLYETLIDAATAYETAFEGGTEQITDAGEYRRAYGAIIDASTRQLEAVPNDARGAIRAGLDNIARRTLPGPTPPADPRNPETVLGELSGLADQVAQTAGIDPTFPATDPGTPDQLRSLKRAVAAAVESWERGDRAGGLAQLSNADLVYLNPAAASVAAVSLALLHEMERGALVELPDAMRSDGDVVAAGTDLDADIDEAIAQIEQELELLREG